VAGLSSGGTNNAPSNNPENYMEMQGTQDETYITRIINEGGNRFVQHLLMKAVDLSTGINKVPVQFCDIMSLPKQQQEEWKLAYRDELEALTNRHIYEIIDLPPDQKLIKNRWVFSVKSDGRK
jgi:hypothetical protein